MMDERVVPRFSPPAGRLRAVALVGFMGAGKTTVGQSLSTRLGWRFCDLDEAIQIGEGRTIEQIFRESGEPAFREFEHEYLKKTIESPSFGKCVLALGGGAFIDPRIHALLVSSGVPAVFLDAPLEELFRRCDQPSAVRPLRRDPKHFRELYEQRRPTYLKARLRVSTQGKPIALIVEEIISGLDLLPASGASL